MRKTWVIGGGIVTALAMCAAVYAASTAVLYPVADGFLKQFSTSNGGTTHYTLVNETKGCDGNATFVASNIAGQQDTYVLDISSIPIGSTLDSVVITPCVSSNSTSPASSTAQVSVIWNKLLQGWSPIINLSSTPLPPIVFPAQTITTNLTHNSTADLLEIGIRNGGVDGTRLSEIRAIINYH